MSIRLHFVVEGQTEETFVNHIIVPHLALCSVWGDARQVMTRKHGHIFNRGGLKNYEMAKNDLVLWMKEDHNADAYFTSMFDLYTLPSNFPKYEECKKIKNPYKRVEALEEAFKEDIDYPHFIPYIQLHEFEALVLTDPTKLYGQFDGYNREIEKIINMASKFESPELINDGQETAPSKRIISEIPEYDGRKPSLGPIITEKIGLSILRQKCNHFNQWIGKCEALTGVQISML